MTLRDVVVRGLPEYDRHERVIRAENEKLGAVCFIAIHRKRNGNPSLGATRVWSYGEETDALCDTLRLSRGMSYKSAFADLPYGGAKAAIMVDKENRPDRKELFSWYAEVVNALEGAFVTGSDVGVSAEDLGVMHAQSKFVIGDGVSAEYYTAAGVLQSIQAALRHIYGSPQLAGRTFAIQGLGKTGLELVRLLYPDAGKIFVSDVQAEKVSQACEQFLKVVAVSPSEIHMQKVDVFSPCALYHSVNSKTLPELRCRAIAGSANNQLGGSATGDRLQKRGILYIPDYVANNGGLISVADQYAHGVHDDSRILRKLAASGKKLENVLIASRSTGLSPLVIAHRHIAPLVV